MATSGVSLPAKSTFVLASTAPCDVQNVQATSLHVVVVANAATPAETDPYHEIGRGEFFRHDLAAGDTFLRNPTAYPVVAVITE